jgi:hypothetical protein
MTMVAQGSSVRILANVTCAALALSGVSCSHASSLAAGPAVRFAHDEARRGGGEGLGRAVIGNSTGQSLLGLEASGRVLATSREQLAGIGCGPAWLGSFGRGLATIEGTPMLAFEHVPGSVLTLGTLRGALGLGYAFEHETSWHDAPSPDPAFVHALTKSTALTLELSGALDAPVTRSPEYSVSVLIGIAWLEQWHTVRREDAPAPYGGLPRLRATAFAGR